jgi:hypothetical protein
MLFNRGRRALMLVTLLVSASLVAWSASTSADESEQKLEAAIQQEIVLGDLKGAMVQYQIVIREAATKASISRALYRYARCLEKLERRTEAHDVYTRVVKDFSDQPEAAFARAHLADWEYSVSAPANLDFDQGIPGKLPDSWFVPALPTDVDRWAQLRRNGCMNHDSCAVVLVPDNAPVRVGNLMQSFKATAYRGKVVRLSAWLRLDPDSPDDHGQMWLSIDRSGDKKGFFDDMSDRAIHTTGWTLREIQARVDEDATFIKFGVMSIGRGRVWVDHVSFAVVSDAGARKP